jgi:carboxyl-terminal processing protease
MTIQKFYRINGGSTQLNGVKPDIVMSDPYTYFEIGERELKFPLEFDKVPAAQYTPYKNEKLFAELKFRSLNRMKNDPAFKLLDENAHRLKEQRDKTKLPLKLEEFIAQRDAMDELAKKYESLGKDTVNMNVLPIPEDLAKVSSDTTKKDIFTKWLKSLKTDNYVLEATRILNDWNAVGLARKN